MSIMKPEDGALRVYVVNGSGTSPEPIPSIEYSAGNGIDITNHVISVTAMPANSAISSTFSAEQQYYNRYITDNQVNTAFHFGNRVESLNGGIIASSYFNIDTHDYPDSKQYQMYGYHSEGGHESQFNLKCDTIEFYNSSAGNGWFGSNFIGIGDADGKKTTINTTTLEVNYYPDEHGHGECIESMPLTGLISLYHNGPSALNISGGVENDITAGHVINVTGLSSHYFMRDPYYPYVEGTNDIVSFYQNNMDDVSIANEYGIQLIGGKYRIDTEEPYSYQIWEKTELSNRMFRAMSGNGYDDTLETFIDSNSISINDRNNEIQFFSDRMIWNGKTIMYSDLFTQFGT